MIHIWTEDSENSCTVQFWKFITEQLCYDKKVEINITGFGSYSKLLKYISNSVENAMINGVYIILIDKVADNSAAVSAYIRLNKIVKSKKNIYISDLHSFEYMMLMFEEFEHWTKPYIDKTSMSEYGKYFNLIPELSRVIDNGLSIKDSEILSELNKSSKKVSTEKIAYIILRKLTKLSDADFVIEKTYLGNCWTCRCCLYNNNECSLSKCKMGEFDKAKVLFNKSYATKIIHNAGVQFESNEIIL